jgi:hypothetical protein
MKDYKSVSLSLPICKTRNFSARNFHLVQHVSPMVDPKRINENRTTIQYCNINGLEYNKNVKTQQNSCRRAHR